MINKILSKILICIYLISYIKSTTFMSKCSNNEECFDLYNKSYFCVENICKHEEIFPLDLKKGLGLLMIILVSAFANAGGIGGGEIIVPVYIFLFSQTVSDSIPLSKATIFAGAFINYFMIFRLKNSQNQNKLLIDYKISAFIIPLVLAGTMIGVLLTKLFPPLFIFAFLILYIGYSTFDIFYKAKKLWKEENQNFKNKEKMKENLKLSNENDFKKSLVVETLSQNQNDIKIENLQKELEKEFSVSISDKEQTLSTKSSKDLISNSSLNELKDYEKNISKSEEVVLKDNYKPKSKFIFILFKKQFFFITLSIFTYLFLLVISLLRGGKGFQSIISLQTCSAPSWTLFIIAQLFGAIVSIFVYKKEKLKIENYKKENINKNKNNKIISKKSFKEDEDDDKNNVIKNQKTKTKSIIEELKINFKNNNNFNNKKVEKQISKLEKLQKLGFLSYITGILAGSLGIGGGIIMNPVLLQLGYEPRVAASISSFLVLFTSLSTSTQFFIIGAFDFNYAFIIFIFSAIGSFIGNLIIMKLLKKYNRPSLIVWVLFGLLLLSFIILPPVGFWKILQQKSYFSFGSLC